MSLFLPKQPEFYELFEQISQTLIDMAGLFSNFAKEFNNFPEYSKKAHEIENQGDKLTHDVIDKLNKSFITPFDREDVYQLAHELDDIIDLIENVIHNVELYRITQKDPSITQFSDLISDAANQLSKLLACLRHQKHTQEFAEIKIKIHNLEDKADDIFTSSISALFSNGKDPVAIIKEKDVLEGLEKIMDKFQQVSDIVEGILVKSS